MRMRTGLLFAAALVAVPAQAGVSDLGPNTFIIHHVVEIEGGSPEQAYRRFIQIGRWWNPDHSYSGKASNLKLRPKAGGCLCEALPRGGSVEHLRVSLVQPGEHLVL